MLMTLRLSWHADKTLPFHLIYLAEACHILRWLTESGVQHVHAHFGTNSAEVVLLSKILGGPTYSFTVHGPEEFDKPERLKLKDKVHHSLFVVAITSFCRSQLFRWVNCFDWPKIHEVHCGLERAFYDIQPVKTPVSKILVNLAHQLQITMRVNGPTKM